MPKTTTHRTKTITIRVGPNLKAELERYAALREMSMGEFVRYCALVYMDTTLADPDEEFSQMDGDEPVSAEELAAHRPLEISQVRRG